MNWPLIIYGFICLIIGHIWGCLSKAGEIKKLRDFSAEVLAVANAELKLLDEMKAHIDELEKQIDAEK